MPRRALHRLAPCPPPYSLTPAHVPFQAIGLAPKKTLSPERLSHSKLLYSDCSGRSKATSIVDEVVFNKTAADGFIHGSNLQANFTTDQHGEFEKGARFCVPGPEQSVR